MLGELLGRTDVSTTSLAKSTALLLTLFGFANLVLASRRFTLPDAQGASLRDGQSFYKINARAYIFRSQYIEH